MSNTRLKDKVAQRFYLRLIQACTRLAHRRECPLCGWAGFQFNPAKPGPFFRFDALCPNCGCAERHRLAYTLLKSELPARVGRVLHVAPEPYIAIWLKSIADDYLSGDYMAPAMVKLDLRDMQFEDGRFDLIWCSHVLEHVDDDRRAIGEIARVLAPGGVAILQVPMWGDVTREHETFSSEEEHDLAYFQGDHVRIYGRDLLQRLEAPGLPVVRRTVEELPLHQVLLWGLYDLAGRDIYLMRRPA